MNVSDKILEVLTSEIPFKSGEIVEKLGLTNNGTLVSPKRCYYALKNK